jgi:quinol monooxygenase YgiN
MRQARKPRSAARTQLDVNCFRKLKDEKRGRQMNSATHYVILRAKSGKEGELLNLLNVLLDRMAEEACLVYFSILQDQIDPTVFMLYENWRDAAEYANVRDSDYRKDYVAQRDLLLREPPEVVRWNMLRKESGRFASG